MRELREVLIGGVRYIPESGSASSLSIGVAVTTHNRRDIAEKTVAHMRDHAHSAVIVIVDDASTDPYPGATFRFDQQAGIARAKNKCLELLMAAGVEHLFLFDDDTWPTEDGWSDRYTNSPEPHLCYLFKDPGRQGQPLATPATVFDDGRTFAYAHPRGCMLYMHRTVVERVGGFRPEFQVWGHEHVEYSRRIFNAGLTSNPFQDAHGAAVLYSMDEHWHEHPEFERSVKTADRRVELARNEQTYQRFRHSIDYVEYRELPDLVVTTLLTLNPDPQRRRKMPANPELVAAWAKSCRTAHRVVLADELPTDGTPGLDIEVVRTAASNQNPYLQRWYSIYAYLRDHPARWVWVTDGTDVEMLNEPWAGMRSDTLYIGDEQTVVGCKWMRDNHPAYTEWITDNADRQLMNAGVVGGSHRSVLEFAHAMVREIVSVTEAGGNIGIGDMAAFNKAVTEWPGRVVHGPQVTTTFRADERNDHSWWKHK